MMKYLIVGLGNIGAEYEFTRHNIGFEVLDYFVKKDEKFFKQETLGSLAELKYRGRTLYLLKPNTYMNRSGKSVSYWMNKLKIPKENIFVVVDDLALPFGKLRIRSSGSDAGHNGLKDINFTLGGNDYPRLRFGIGNEFKKGQQIDYVLGVWTPEESEKLPELIEKSIEAVKAFCFLGIQLTMTNFNK
jgi:peptidyl-tRNA hydrolase, PTH1 family